MTTTDLGLTDALVRLSHLVQSVFADASRERGLTPQQTQLLCMLIGGPVGMTELSRLLHLEKSSLTGLVDRVERHGLVARAPDPRDRRALHIALTARGADAANAAHRDVTARLEKLAGELRPADKDLLTAAIAGLLAADTAATGRVWRPARPAAHSLRDQGMTP